MPLTPAERTAAARQRTKTLMAQERAKGQVAPKQGGLARSSIFADEFLPVQKDEQKALQKEDGTQEDAEDHIGTALTGRSPQQMAARIDPNPKARIRWQKRMIIRSIRRSGRPTREMLLARTERAHTSKSHFFKTSVKKLAPLARQIAGKSIDEAILQMRFSSKKAAAEVQKHLIQARNEAIVMRGMGVPPVGAMRPTTLDEVEFPEREVSTANVQERILEAIQNKNASKDAALPIPTDHLQSINLTQSSAASDRKGAEITTPAETAPLPSQTPTKSTRKGISHNPTDIYIAQAWVNRGKYGFAANHRARGRIDRLRLPYTGISVLLKEERTRTREKVEKEVKAIRKRLNGKVWTQLPDRPIVRQSQYVLW